MREIKLYLHGPETHILKTDSIQILMFTISKLSLLFFLVLVRGNVVRLDAHDISSTQRLPYDAWQGDKIMFVYAHIDDMEASSGGLVTLLADKSEVFLVILTNGDKGCGNPNVCGNSTNAQVAAIRMQVSILLF